MLVSLVLPVAVQGVTLYKWVDAEGNVSYQDTPPPAGQKYEERSFSVDGARTGNLNAEVARSQAVLNNPIILYRADNCDSCDLVETILNGFNAPFTGIPVDIDETEQQKLLGLIGSIRVPTLTIGDTVINGTNRAAIEDALRAGGYPDPEVQTNLETSPETASEATSEPPEETPSAGLQ